MDGRPTRADPDAAELLASWRAASRLTEQAHADERRAERVDLAVAEAEAAAIAAHSAAGDARAASDRAREAATEAIRTAGAVRALLAAHDERGSPVSVADAEDLERRAKDAYHEAQQRLFADLEPAEPVPAHRNGAFSVLR